MLNPELYEENNDFQKRDARRCIERYKEKIAWKQNAKIIDLGCGNGFVTSKILARYVPTNFKSILGVDISKEMVQYANKHFSDDRIGFKLMDAVGDLPSGFEGSFHHAFSFYALHWMPDQEKAFANIYDLLCAGGDCLLMFMCSCVLFDMFRVLSRMQRWNPWVERSIKSIDRFVIRYHDLDDPVKEVRRIMTATGFKKVSVDCNKSPYEYQSLESLKTFIQSLNPFKVPCDLLEEFGEDGIRVLEELGVIRGVPGDQPVQLMSTQLVAYGMK